MRGLHIFGWALLFSASLQGQATRPASGEGPGSLDSIGFTAGDAWQYVSRAVTDAGLWRSGNDQVKEELQRLLDQVEEPFDTVLRELKTCDFSRIPVSTGAPRAVDSTLVRWINDSVFVIDPNGWNQELYLKKEMKLVYPVDLSTLQLSDSILDENGMLDSTLFTPDTVFRTVIDTAAIRSLDIRLHTFDGTRVTPPLTDPDSNRIARLSIDKKYVEYLIPDTRWVAGDDSPFRLLRNSRQLDSLQAALDALLNFIQQSDSTELFISDINGNSTRFWISSGSDNAQRLWVRNYNNDSLTLWLGNPGPDEISLVLEDDVNFSRLNRAEIDYLPSFKREPDKRLHQMSKLEPIPIYWDYAFSSAISLSQTFLSNWIKGGESSLATLMDLMGRATYNNKEASTQWINVGRLKFGTISTAEKGFRKNNDEFTLDSKFNRNAWGKIGMSASFYMKNQVAHGYQYPSKDSAVLVSKFLNPGTMTIGIGAEYKPFKKTTVNLAPVSYKTTFVLDTVHIDQTQHGIDQGKKAKQEFGMQLVVESEVSPLEGLELVNRARFFSNYLDHPENIDVDWEVNVSKQIAWFFTVSLNLHLIYDDNVRFTVYDSNDMPVLNQDGSEKKVARTQLKEFLGLTLSVKL